MTQWQAATWTIQTWQIESHSTLHCSSRLATLTTHSLLWVIACRPAARVTASFIACWQNRRTTSPLSPNREGARGSLTWATACLVVSYCIVFCFALPRELQELTSDHAMSNTRQCYTPNGAVWEGHTPCNQSADESHCCEENDFCLSNGHCLQAAGSWANRIGRGSCTDFQWRSDKCPYECAHVLTNQDCALLVAFETPDGTFCCDQNYNTETKSCPISNAHSGTMPFNMTLGRVIWNRTDGSVMDKGTLSPSEVQVSEAQTTVTLQPSSLTSDSSSGNVTTVAAGIAVPLGVLLLASLVAITFLWSKLRSLKKELGKSDEYAKANGTSAYAPMGPATGSSSPYTALPKYQPMQYQHQHYNEAPVEREVVEADARTPVQELGH